MVWTWWWAVRTMYMSVSVIWGMVMVAARLWCVVVAVVIVVATRLWCIVVVSAGFRRVMIVTARTRVVAATGTRVVVATGTRVVAATGTRVVAARFWSVTITPGFRHIVVTPGA